MTPACQQVLPRVLSISSVSALTTRPFFEGYQGIPMAALEKEGACLFAYAQYLENIREGKVLNTSYKTHLNINLLRLKTFEKLALFRIYPIPIINSGVYQVKLACVNESAHQS